MCGRFVSAIDADGIVRFFSVDERKTDDLPASWNVAPTDQVYAVVEHDRRRLLVALRWGLIPSWADDHRIGSRLINARVETVADKQAFRGALARRRCLVPADGFYEWASGPDGGKVPHFIHHPNRRPLALAALWEVWRAHDGAPVRTFTILTMPAGAGVHGLHDRMPVVLPEDAWAAWLDRGLQDPGALDGILRAAGAPLVHHPVSTDVNSTRSNHPGLIEPSPMSPCVVSD